MKGNGSLSFFEKSGYAMGDAAANLVWRGALAYLAVFYTDVLGISAVAASILILTVRLSDGITDIIMGMIADRTNTRWGKYRPWIVFSAPALGLFMVLCFTVPNLDATGKLIWAYATYIGLTLAYTANNVPYSALMGVMTNSHAERGVLSSWRFFGAFLGGALVSGFLPSLVNYFGKGNEATGYQYSMYLFSIILVSFLLVTFFSTKERVVLARENMKPFKAELFDLLKSISVLLPILVVISMFFYYREIYSGLLFIATLAVYIHFGRKFVKNASKNLSTSQLDLRDLLTCKPWWILLCCGFLFMMFNGIRFASIAYYFKYYVQADDLTIFGIALTTKDLTGMFFIALLITSMIAAVITSFAIKYISKKTLFMASFFFGGALTCLIYFIGPNDLLTLFILGALAEFFAAIMPIVFFSMLGDTADYSEYMNKRRATGLFFSAGTFINKTGGGFSGALVLMVLAFYGYDGLDSSTVSLALPGLKLLMSWIPASFAFAAMIVLYFYSLNNQKMDEVEAVLKRSRAQ